MPAKPNKSARPEAPSFWQFDATRKIIAGLLFFAGAAACVFLSIPHFMSEIKIYSDLVIPGLLFLFLAGVLLQLARRKDAFVTILLGLALLGGFAGWGMRLYANRLAEQKVIVLVFKFDGQESEHAIREQILKELNTAAAGLPDVEIVSSNELVTRDQNSEYARQLGLKAHADLVIWAWYDANLAPRTNLFIEDVTPATLDIPLPTDPAKPQPVVAYLSAFAMRRSFFATSDTFVTLMSALLNYKSGNYQAFLDQSAQVLSQKDASMLVVPHDLNFYVGLSHTARGELDLAIEAYNRALKADRKGQASYINRALAYIEQGKYDLALKDCNIAQVIDNQNSLVYNTRGLAYMGQKEYALAGKEFSKAIESDLTNPNLFHNRALAYQALGEANFAAADFKKEADLRNNQP